MWRAPDAGAWHWCMAHRANPTLNGQLSTNICITGGGGGAEHQ